MKQIYFLAQKVPEFNFIVPNFDSYVNALTENFLLLTLLFFGAMVLAFAFYYGFCVLFLFWNRLMASPYSYENSRAQVETSINS